MSVCLLLGLRYLLQAISRKGVLRVEAQGNLKFGSSGVEVAEVQKNKAEVAVRLEIVWLQKQLLLKLGLPLG